MKIFLSLLVAIGATIPIKAGKSKKELEDKLLPVVVDKWLACRGIEGEFEGHKLTEWTTFEAARDKLSGVKYFYGSVLVTDVAECSGRLNQIYSNVDNKLAGNRNEGKGIAPIEKLSPQDLPAFLDTDKIISFARSKSEEVFGKIDKKHLAIAYHAFKGPALSAGSTPQAVTSVESHIYLFLVLAVGD